MKRLLAYFDAGDLSHRFSWYCGGARREGELKGHCSSMPLRIARAYPACDVKQLRNLLCGSISSSFQVLS